MNITGNIDGKIAALRPSFELMAEVTGKGSTATLMGLYANYFVNARIAPEYVNRTVEQMMASWQKSYWPSADTIATSARQMQQASLTSDGGGGDREKEIADACESEGRRRWADRVHRATTWRDANPDRFTALWKPVSAQIHTMTEMDVHVHLRTVPAYLRAFREGAGISICLREMWREHMADTKRIGTLQRQRAAALHHLDESASA